MSIHNLLEELGPCEYSSVPEDGDELANYIQDAIAKCQDLIDSVPPPPSTSLSSSKSTKSGAEEMSESDSTDSLLQMAATPDTPVNEELRCEWGKPLKLSAKDNPHGMSVYKMSSKDRRGAWFARRSVHHGLDFAKWQDGLENEFEDSLRLKGKPGEGNIRGIGGDEKMVTREIPDIGKVEVMRLTAQFPGPSSPRDFVELLLSSTKHSTGKNAPRQYMLVSKPVAHSDMPAQDGYVRGQYESVEFIRELPVQGSPSSSTTSLASGEENGGKTSENSRPGTERFSEDNKNRYRDSGVELTSTDNGKSAPNPVEWIMITRSDPGGSVPRFMVERGTPGAIINDAGKFIKWATCRATSETPESQENGSNVSAQSEGEETITRNDKNEKEEKSTKDTVVAAVSTSSSRLTRTVTAVSDSSSASSDSFVSAGGDALEETTPPSPPIRKRANTSSSTLSGLGAKYDKEEQELCRKLATRRARLELRLAEARERHGDNEAKQRADEEKHTQRLEEANEWHDKQLAKIMQRRERAERKERESGSKHDLRQRIDALVRENNELRERVAELEQVCE